MTKLIPLVETTEPGLGYRIREGRPTETEADHIAASARRTSGCTRQMAQVLDDLAPCKAYMCHFCVGDTEAVFAELQDEWDAALTLYDVPFDPTIRL